MHTSFFLASAYFNIGLKTFEQLCFTSKQNISAHKRCFCAGWIMHEFADTKRKKDPHTKCILKRKPDKWLHKVKHMSKLTL